MDKKEQFSYTTEISFSYLTERRKAKLSSFTQFSINVDSDQILTKRSPSWNVNYSHWMLGRPETI